MNFMVQRDLPKHMLDIICQILAEFNRRLAAYILSLFMGSETGLKYLIKNPDRVVQVLNAIQCAMALNKDQDSARASISPHLLLCLTYLSKDSSTFAGNSRKIGEILMSSNLGKLKDQHSIGSLQYLRSKLQPARTAMPRQ